MLAELTCIVYVPPHDAVALEHYQAVIVLLPCTISLYLIGRAPCCLAATAQCAQVMSSSHSLPTAQRGTSVSWTT